jgi:hypothetical protein
MMNQETLREQVAQQIKEAFAETPYPGDEKVAAYARYGRTIADALRGKHWGDVPLDALVQHRWEIFLLTPESFRFYAPLFMLAALIYHTEMEAFADNLLFTLTPQREEHIDHYFAGIYTDYFSRRAAAFTQHERAAVLMFLETFAALYPHENSLYKVDLAGNTIPFWRRAAQVG